MPESAIASGCIDFVLSPEDIAQELYELRTRCQKRGEGGVAGRSDFGGMLKFERDHTLFIAQRGGAADAQAPG